MKNFFDQWEDFRKDLKDKKLLIFLDFDGTLAAIVDHYKSATILQESKALLKQIAKNPGCCVAIVSGRALPDLKKRVGLKNIIYAGNHGLEIEGPGITYTSFVKADVKSSFRKIKSDLLRRIGKIKGILIEDKGLTLSVHYRRVDRKDLVLFRQIFLESAWPYLKSRRIGISQGKKVFDIKPAVKWNKGRAALWLINCLGRRGHGRKAFPIFIGDDVTDETAFIALKKKGLCIRVGCGRPSAAQYCLRDINQVARFLRTVLDLKSGRIIFRGV